MYLIDILEVIDKSQKKGYPLFLGFFLSYISYLCFFKNVKLFPILPNDLFLRTINTIINERRGKTRVTGQYNSFMISHRPLFQNR